MPIIIILLLQLLLINLNIMNDADVGTTITEEVTTEETTEDTTEETTVSTDVPLVGNNYDLIIDGDGLNMKFEEDRMLTIGEFMEAFEGDYEITEEFLYVNVVSTYYNETVKLELTYDDLTLDVISGTVNNYELVVEDSNVTEEELAEYNEQFMGLPYTLELTSGQ